MSWSIEEYPSIASLKFVDFNARNTVEEHIRTMYSLHQLNHQVSAGNSGKINSDFFRHSCSTNTRADSAVILWLGRSMYLGGRGYPRSTGFVLWYARQHALFFGNNNNEYLTAPSICAHLTQSHYHRRVPVLKKKKCNYYLH